MSEVSTSRVRARRIRTATLALLSVTAAAALVAGSAQSAPRSFFGLVPNSDLNAADYRMIRDANVGAARVAVFWQTVEPGNNSFDWSSSDRLIGEFASRGIRTLPQLYGTPAWLSSSPVRPPVYSKAQKREWKQFVGEAVKRYGKGGTYWTTSYERQFPGAKPKPIKTWQVWNEQNGPKHFSPKPNVGKYATLLRISKQAIKREHRKGKIVLGGMASEPTGKGGIDAWKYVRKLLKKKRAKRSFDHVALHPYAPNQREIFKHVKKMRRALKKGGKKKAQTWITEVGWSSNPGGEGKLWKSPKQQAKLLKRTYKRLARKRKSWNIGGVYWYTWRDFAGGVCDWCPTAGLVTPDRKPKPAYTSYKQVAGR